MRTLLNTFLFIGLFSCWLHADEIIPGVLSFKPTNLNMSVYLGSFPGADQPPVYTFSPDKQDGRQIEIKMRPVGVVHGEGKSISYRQLDENALKGEFTNAFGLFSNATNVNLAFDINIVSPLADTKLGGQKAISASFNYVRKDGVFLGSTEVYWVQVQTNRVVEVLLRTQSNSKEQLDSLRKCLPSFKIKSQLQK